MVFVDPLRDNGWDLGPNSHLFVEPDTALDVLHNFARRLDLRRYWFQHKPWKLPHYDVTEKKRKQAVEMGAIEKTAEETVAVLRAWRDPAKHVTTYRSEMRALGTGFVRLGGAKEMSECDRWVLRYFGLRDGAEVTAAEWARIDGLQNFVVNLR